MEDIEKEISMLEEEMKERVEKLRQKRSPKSVGMTYSTPRDQIRNLTDSGIIQTRGTGLLETEDRTTLNQVPDTENVPSLFGPYRDIEEVGTRPKQSQRRKPTLTSRSGSSPLYMDVSPILGDKPTYSEQISENRNIDKLLERRKPSPSRKIESEKTERREIKVANYDGSNEWFDFKSHFDACAIINKWDVEDRGLYLAASLRGHAQAVFSDLPIDKKMNYETLVKALEERFAPPNQNELYRVQLKERRQRASETLPELGQTIRRLVNRAYPQAPSEVKETLAKDHFLDALQDTEMRIKIKQSRPENLNQTICLAVELEAFYKAEKKQEYGRAHMRATHPEYPEPLEEDRFSKMMETFTKQFDSLRQELEDYKKNDRGKSNSEWRKTIQCYNCGKTGHLRRECRLPRVNGNRNYQAAENNNKGNEQGSVGTIYSGNRTCRRRQAKAIKLNVNNNSTNEAGAYIDVVIAGKQARFLVDTGATVTIISCKLFYVLENRPALSKIKQSILSANGTELNVVGKGNFNVQIGQENYSTDAVVAELAMDGIIGLDFLRENHCTINLQEETMICGNHRIPLQFMGRLGCFRVSVAEDTCIPPGTEAIIPGRIIDNESPGIKMNNGIVEPSEAFIAKDSALLAKTLVKVADVIPLRLLNVSEEAKIIRAGTVVGNISPIEEVVTEVKEVNRTNDYQTKQTLNSELQKLVVKCGSNLNGNQKEVVRSLLDEYTDLFAVTDKDLGRTNLVQHKINTGNNAPVKQPPRRTPIYMRDEIDNHIDDMLERGVIEPADGPWSSGIVLVRKKRRNDPLLC